MVACKFLLPRQLTNIPGIQHTWFVVQLMMMYGNDKDAENCAKFETTNLLLNKIILMIFVSISNIILMP